jgi:MFS transporter, CP family, cyanate transporter
MERGLVEQEPGSVAAGLRRGALDRRTGGALLVVSLLLMAVNLRASLTSLGPLLDGMTAELGLSSTTAGLLSAAPLLAFGVISPLAPPLARRIGLERALFAAALSLAAGIALRSAPTVAALFTGTAVLGVGIAIGNVLLPALVKRDFPTSVGSLTSGYVTVMGFMAAVAAALVVPLSHMLPGGWRTALGCWAVPAVLAAVMWLPHTRRRASGPVPARPVHPVGLPWRAGLAWLVTVFMGLQSFGFYVVIAWGPSVLGANGVSATSAGWQLGVLQVVGVVASLATPLVMRRLPDQRLLAVGGSMISLLGYLSLVVVPGWPMVSVVLLGVGSGVTIVLALAFMGLRTLDASTAAALSAMAQSIGYLIAATGPVLFGLLHSVTATWKAPLLLLSLIALVQATAGFLAGRGALPAPADRDRLDSARSGRTAP